ncbi:MULTISPECIES: MarR family winged helix-turn-helix transcriptional regulator [unclassified Olsenella]|uniref:MarR family winged helix-turn-helix transcriptional regulator n=1 Tax=Olsenella TaxID=133925 RepID=UPI000231F258|nr:MULTISPECIES: MarR family transcriptional regulator [unclassified Olsenella]EHF01348.1 hypothetical protein HMPREF1008_01828 [Olsenella sp. oral taxon 809 str. F0356]KXB63907.1 transcriptional regulator, MarR family [Olsenella sp. DNF00959]
MNTTSEPLLHAWLHLATTIDNVSISAGLTRNEMMVCYALYLQDQRDPSIPITPTQIAQRTKIRKSQVNRNLNQLEEKGIITREHSKVDRRRVFVHLNKDNVHAFEKEYKVGLDLVDEVVKFLGVERANDIARAMEDVAKLAEEQFPMGPM